MSPLVLLSGLLLFGLIVVVGCSSSSTQPAEINGMTPAEYREKGELSGRSAPAKAQKTKDPRR
jgi:hypothetical protein